MYICNRKRKSNINILKYGTQHSLATEQVQRENRGGKWHARVVSNGVTSTNDLAESIQENTTSTRGEVTGIIMALVDEISYSLSLGNTVVLDGLGRFHLTVE